ncbi:hypothetical protein BURK2_03130 [Burkholderiales bacterium]|nr:MAG: hypothetical protein F9K47_03290 [Burkholderiales bacterium]CAG1002286.1 hypothetical protein BURK2_03130 [Burkholderiales bacterium]
MKVWRYVGLAALAALICGSTWAQPAEEAALRAQLARIETLRGERPKDDLLVFYRAMTQTQLGAREAALADLRSLVGRHRGLIPAPGAGFERLWEDEAFQSLRAQLSAEEPKTQPDAAVLARLTGKSLVPEGIAYDPKTRRLFVGSIHRRKIVTLDARGRQEDWSRAEDRLDGILGLCVDVPRRLLWAVSTNGSDDEAEKARRNALIAWDIKTRRVVHRVELPQAQHLNDLTIAVDGTVYASDSFGSTIWVLSPGAANAVALGKPGELRGANGLALGPKGELYVAISTGIARVEIASGAWQRLAQPDEWVTGGIDGLYYHRGALIGVQNGPNPGRVLRLELSADGRSMTALDVLQSHHHPEFDEPTTGAIVGEHLIVIANSHIARRRPDGSIAGADRLRAPVLIKVPLAARH